MTIREELQDLYDQYVVAYRSKDADGCAAVFTEDSKLLSPYGPVATGRDGIRNLHATWLQEDTQSKQLKVIEAGTSGDTAWCLAEFSEGEAEAEGFSLNVFERQPEGGWLIRMCSLNDKISEPI